jgi:hypothetical protein
VLGLLRHAPPQELQQAPVGEQLQWAITAWNPAIFHGVKEIIASP